MEDYLSRKEMDSIQKQGGYFPRHWSYSTTNDYVITQVALGLEEAGVFDFLRKEKATTTSIAKTLNINEYLLDSCLNFLWSVTNAIEKNPDNTFTLKDRDFANPFYIIKAYKSVFDNIGPALQMKIKYGDDIRRDGAYLQRSSEIVTRSGVRNTIDRMPRDISYLVDLGCGSAESLIYFCKSADNRHGHGIDIDSLTALKARNNIASNQLSERISIAENDILDTAKWKTLKFGLNTAILASTILHELLAENENRLINFLRELREFAYGSRLYILELDTPDFESLKNEENEAKKLFFATYRLWHPFSAQGMPMGKDSWEKLLKRAGLHIDRIRKSEYELNAFECIL